MFHTKSGGQNFRTAASCSVLSRGHPAPHVLALFTLRRAPELPTAGRGAHLEVVSRTTAIEEILSDVARVRADTRTPRLGFFSAVDEACNEIPAFIDQLDIICFTSTVEVAAAFDCAPVAARQALSELADQAQVKRRSVTDIDGENLNIWWLCE